MGKKLTYIDLFAGAGGLSEGFIRGGFDPIAHIEMDASACKTLETRMGYHYLKTKGLIKDYNDYISGKTEGKIFQNLIPEILRESVINQQISHLTLNQLFNKIDDLKKTRSVDVIIGGPPCQAYSLAGRARDPNRMKNDHRNYLFRYYAEFLKKYKPRFFVFENVTGLLTASDYFKQMKALFESEEVGYKIAWQVLDASDYGVLQKRKRVIIIGRRGRQDFEFPEIHTIKNLWKIKQDLFSDLPPLKPGESGSVSKYITRTAGNYLNKFEIRNGVSFVTQHITREHNKRDLEIYERAIKTWLNEKKRMRYDELPKHLRTHKNLTAFLDRYKVVNPDGHSHTMVAHIAKDGHYYIYPDLNQVRSISVREAARIQSFPDDYYFEGGRTAAFRQIGNAVPPAMARAIADSIQKISKSEI